MEITESPIFHQMYKKTDYNMLIEVIFHELIYFFKKKLMVLPVDEFGYYTLRTSIMHGKLSLLFFLDYYLLIFYDIFSKNTLF